MKINSSRRRKAISPVLATVILIAITLIAAIAVAGFVFGLFGTFTSGQNLQLVGTSCASAAAAKLDGVTAHTATNDCLTALTNTGGAAGSITACSIYGASQTIYGGTTTAHPTTLTAETTVAVPAGTTSGAPIVVECDSAAGLTAGAAISGSLVVASGSPLAFSTISS